MLSAPLQTAADFMSGRGSLIALIAAILFGSAFGMARPEAGAALAGNIDATILLLVFLLLFEVRIENIVSSLNRAGFIGAALVANFIIIPVLGFAIASVFLAGRPLFAVGLVIYFMAPCTDWFLGFTRLAKGNTALGAALLPINMIVQLLLYPFYLQLFGIDAVEKSAGAVFQTLGQWFLAPLVAAAVFRFLADRLFSERLAQQVQSAVSIVVPVLLAVLVGQIAAANIETLTANVGVFPLILGAIFLFFVLTYFLSEAISKLMRLRYEDRVLMTMTTAARNAPLMLALTIAVIPDQPTIYAAIVIGMLIELPHLVALKTILVRRRAATDAAVATFGGEPLAR
ncbi:MAG: arsenic resistance protein [Pseudomonadota bacterium]